MILYDKIELAIRNHCPSITVDEVVTDKELYSYIRKVLRDNPDIFWFAHKVHYYEAEHTLSFQYLFSPERVEQLKRSIDDVLKHDFNIDYVRTLSQIDKVMYVYMWIISYCNYNINSAFNQEIDSVFVRRNSVCTGYAKAAQYLFSLLDIESQLVFGQLNNPKSKQDRHCWNIVKINCEYYHLDVSLGDQTNLGLLATIGIKDIIIYKDCCFNFFGISTQEISKTRSIEDIQSLPLCAKNINHSDIAKYASSIRLHKRASHIGCLLSKIGSSADIYLSSTDKKTVLKVFRDNGNSACFKEYSYMKRLVGSPHLIQLREKETDLKNNILGIEQSTPILDLFFSRNFEFSISSLLKMARDIGSAWQECNNNSVIYRDIHLCNIFRSNEGIYKLGDFGSSSTENRIERVGNIWFMSPKTYFNGEYDEHSAIYSITMVMYFILNDLHPAFWQFNDEEAVKQRMSGKALPVPKLLLDKPRHITSPLLDFISKGYQSDRHFVTLNDYLHCIHDIILFYSKHQINIAFNSNDFSFSEHNIKTVNFSSPHLGKDEEIFTIVEVEGHRMESSSEKIFVWYDDFSDTIETNIDDIESYCRTQGGFDNYDVIPSIDNNSISVPPSKQRSDPKTVEMIERNCYTNLPQIDGLAISYKPKYDSTIANKLSGSGLNKLCSKREKQSVYSSIFAPSEVKRATHMLVQVYLHLPKETEKVQTFAQEADKNAERRDYIPLQCKLKKGDTVDVLMNIYSESILMSDKKSVVWQGSFTKCSFDFFVPRDIDVEELSCMAMVCVNGTPVGEMRFITQVVEKPRQLNPEIISRQYHKIFISYAHQDEPKVEQMARAYKAQGVEYFFDRHYLQPGDVFPTKIREFIDSADLFILCWSANAANSDYVELERKRALERAYPRVKPIENAPLRIYPMSIEPRAELPDDMRDTYNFEII